MLAVTPTAALAWPTVAAVEKGAAPTTSVPLPAAIAPVCGAARVGPLLLVVPAAAPRAVVLALKADDIAAGELWRVALPPGLSVRRIFAALNRAYVVAAPAAAPTGGAATALVSIDILARSIEALPLPIVATADEELDGVAPNGAAVPNGRRTNGGKHSRRGSSVSGGNPAVDVAVTGAGQLLLRLADGGMRRCALAQCQGSLPVVGSPLGRASPPPIPPAVLGAADAVGLQFTASTVASAFGKGALCLGSAVSGASGGPHAFTVDPRGAAAAASAAGALWGVVPRLGGQARCSVLESSAATVAVCGAIAATASPPAFVVRLPRASEPEGTAAAIVPLPDGVVDVAPDGDAAEFPTECALCFDDLSLEAAAAAGDDAEAGLTLDCGHAFHAACVAECVSRAEAYVEKGHRITFNMARCPSGCGCLVRHPSFPRSAAIAQRYAAVLEDAGPRAAAEYPGKPASEVLDSFLHYVCGRCGAPFWGGNKDCAAMMGGEPDADPASLVCERCADDFRCPAHGRQFVVYKCALCCNPATHLSMGRRRLCDRCVSEKRKEGDPLPCPRGTGGRCPLAEGHAGGQAALGCLACLPGGTIDTDLVATAAPTEE